MIRRIITAALIVIIACFFVVASERKFPQVVKENPPTIIIDVGK